MDEPAKQSLETAPTSNHGWTAFRQGLTKASLTAMLSMMAVTGGWCALAMVVISPANLAQVDYGYLTTVPFDQYCEVTVLTHRVAQEADDSFAVVVMGDSAIRAALTDPALLEKEILATTGRRIPVHYLSAKGLTVVEMAGMMDLIGSNFRGIAVLQLGQLQLSQTPQQQLDMIGNARLAISSRALDAEWALLGKAPPTRTGNYFVDHWKFFSVRLNAEAARRLIAGPVHEPYRHIYEGPALTDAQWAMATDQMRRDLDTYEQQFSRNQAIVNRMIEQQRHRGPVRWVVMDGSTNPRVARIQKPGAIEKHVENMQAWSRSTGIDYWNLDREAELKDSDFFDFGHVRDSAAQDRYTALLAKKVAALCKDLIGAGKVAP